jgi:hypothetical protein
VYLCHRPRGFSSPAPAEAPSFVPQLRDVRSCKSHLNQRLADLGLKLYAGAQTRQYLTCQTGRAFWFAGLQPSNRGTQSICGGVGQHPNAGAPHRQRFSLLGESARGDRTTRSKKQVSR